MKKALVYCLICPLSKAPRYVGITTRSLDERLKEHKTIKDKSKSHKTNWLKKLKKLEHIKQLEIKLLEEVNEKNIFKREEYWIEQLSKQGYELVNTFWDGRKTNLHHTPETLEKIKLASKNRPRRPFSDEHKRKISLSLIGTKRRVGKCHTEEAKKKMSTSLQGKVPWNRHKINQYDLEMNYIKTWDSPTSAAKELKLNQGNISDAALNKRYRHQCGGFRWRYCDE